MLLPAMPFHDLKSVSVEQTDPLGNSMSCRMPVLAHRDPSTMEWVTVCPPAHRADGKLC